MRKIAMIGTAPSTRSMNPGADPNWEIWGQADYWKDLPKIDRWFEFAPFAKLKAEYPEYFPFLKNATFPIYMRAHVDEIPQSIPFPFEEMSDRFGKEFMSATLVWMMCQAVVEHMEGKQVDTIALFGYDMALDSEYKFQRPGIRHMEWICREHLSALGHPPINVLIPKGSDLALTPIPYPFAEEDPMVVKIRARKRDIAQRINICDRQMAEINSKSAQVAGNRRYLEGAMEDLNYFERMACGHDAPAA